MGKATSLLSNEEYNINTLNPDGESLLHIACKSGHFNCVKTLAIFYRYIHFKKAKNTKNAQNSFGDTPLHLACYGKSIYILRILLEIECLTNIPNTKGEIAQDIPLNDDGDCLLHIACQWGDVDIVRYLITDQRCVLSIQNKHLNTPLHLASYSKNLSIIRFLLERKCNTIIPNKKGETAQDIPLNEDGDTLLHIACQWGDVDNVRYLITDEKCHPNVQGFASENTPLHIAAKYGHDDTIAQLLSYKECNPNAQNKDGDAPLHFATTWDKTAAISKLLAYQHSDINVHNNVGDTPLHLACYKRSLDVVKLFLKIRCSTNIPNKKGETAQDIPLNEDGDTLLHIACQWGDVDIVRYLITDEECNPNVKSFTSENTPLHNAAMCGHDDTIAQLLSYKECNPSAQNKAGDTPLHFAATWNKTAAISKLLAYQHPDINVHNKVGDTPLHLACYKRSLDVVKLLLKMRCNTNIRNKKGETAQDIPLNEDGDTLLHIACQWGDVDIVRYLVSDEKCNPNVQISTSENTPLHIAAKYGQDDTIFKLLSYKECNPNVHNKDYDTPLHFAAKYGQDHTTVQLLLYKECNSNAQNKEGDTPLHIAVRHNKTAVTSQLLAHQQCNPNVENREGDTPLHTAAKYGQDDTIVQLLSCKKCDLNVQNKVGDTPLHIAIRHNKTAAIFQLLAHQKCNPNVENREGNTPLHTAAKYGQDDTIVQLLSCKEWDLSVQNEDGDTPLHTAVRGNVPALSQLLSHKQCNPNIQNKKGDTPLHTAAKYGQGDTIIQLLSCKECDLNVQNIDGDTPLHIAVRGNITPALSQLLSHKQCNPNIQNKKGDIPLHIAANYGQDATMFQLLSYKECNPNVPNKEGDTPLHIAVKENRASAISQLLTSKQCNPNVMNNDHLTPLLTAIKWNNPTVATTLIQHSECDTTLCDRYGNTLLHLACIGGETQPEMVDVAKQLLTCVDPSCVNNAGQTPIELTTNYQLIKAITHMVQCKTKQSVQTYINMFVVGNPETGKSTLVKAICKEASILWKIVPKQVRRVKNVPLHTAGIIPTTFQSKTFGNTVLYDLAGQVEYYTSHAAVIQSTVISTPPAFIVVVNLSESEEKISQALRYWWSFIDNHAAQSSALLQVILVGSHADVVKSTGRSVQEMMTHMSALVKKLSASFHFAGHIALDCRDPASRHLKTFCSLVNQCCTVLRQTADVDLRCHVLYAFLREGFKGKVAFTVSDVATSVKENRELLPQNPDSLIPLLSTLSDKGLLLLVKGGKTHGNWWIILQKQTLLGEINGAIFAPKNFSQHKDLSQSTGVVPFSKLEEEFPDYNPYMVTEFLIHLEFCFKIEDHTTLALLKNEAEDTANEEDTSPDVLEEYYFFPALVSVENPLHIWEENDDMCCKCGWLYKCIRPDQFLTTHFLHVLILRLAFTFALKLDPGDCCEESLALHRKCSVWKHGIAWLNLVPIETVVEVGLQYQSVIVMMRYPIGKEAKCVQLRSEIIQKVIEAKDEHCKAVKMSESFIHPTDVKYPFTDNTKAVKLYSITAIARVTVKREDNVLDHRGRNPIPVQRLLLFDPYSSDTRKELLSELFDRTHSMNEKMRRQVLETLNSEFEEVQHYTCPLCT